MNITKLWRWGRRGVGVLAVAAVASSLALVGCTSSTPEKTADYGELTIQLSWVKNVEFAGEYFADQNGYFKDAGFSSVNFIAGPAATPTIVASGQALVGISDPTRVAPAIAEEGAPVKIIANQYQRSPFSILSLADKANIQTPEDLIGKRIGIQTGNEPLFYALLDANNISHDSVTVVPVEYDPTPLTTGDVDGFLAYVTNESVILKSQGYDVVNLLYADNGLPLVVHSVVASDDSIANKRDELKAFLYASIQGWKAAIADPDEAARLAVEVYGSDLGLDPALEKGQAIEATELMVNDDTMANGLFTITDARAKEVVALLNEIGINITESQLFDFTLLDEVLAEHPELLE